MRGLCQTDQLLISGTFSQLETTSFRAFLVSVSPQSSSSRLKLQGKDCDASDQGQQGNFKM